MTWIHPLSVEVEETADVLGSKAHGLVVLRRLGLPVPPGFVISTAACRAFLRDGRLPDGLDLELATAIAGLEAATGSRLGGAERPLAVAVRSGAAVSMPGMMHTILNVRLTAEAKIGLAAHTDDARVAQLEPAIAAVFASWDTPRAQTYRDLHDIPHDLGTAVIVQAMVFGDRDAHSGAGVAFSRNPNTGAHVPYGEVLFGHQGDDVVSGRSLTRPLHDLAGREPGVWADLLDALNRIEEHDRDACSLEFTFEAGELWLLQVRPGRFTGRAAVRLAIGLVDEGVIGRPEALLRISPQDLRHVHTPRIVAAADVLARGLGACPGVAVGRVAITADNAVRMAAEGPVILVRPETSPVDLHGLAAAAGVVTARGGPASHAAVVARAMGKPAVVGVTDLTVDVTAAHVRVGGRTVPEGALITIDGMSGEVVIGSARIVTTANDPHLHRLLEWADDVSGDRTDRSEAERLRAAHAALPGRDG